MSRHHRNLDGWRWAKVRAAILANADGLCTLRTPGVCTTYATQVDHVIPLSKGGAKYDPANLRAVCRACNANRNRKVPRFDSSFG